MTPDFELRLRAYAEVIVRVGLNLQPGQRLLIGEPYQFHGIPRSAGPLVEAVRIAAGNGQGRATSRIEVILGEAGHLRPMVRNREWRTLSRLVADNARRMNEYVANGDALLFLPGAQPGLLRDLPPDQVAEAQKIGADHFGAVARQLTAGATNWTAAPSPSPEWAEAVYPDLRPEQRLGKLWDAVFSAARIIPQAQPMTAVRDWEKHLRALQRRCDELNAGRFTSLHYLGVGTDLTVALPPEHLWRTACLRSRTGVPFVANLPTEEVFTLPHRNSAGGKIRGARPVAFGGGLIEGIELEFREGRVVTANARVGESLLRRLLETDAGATRLGEIAIVAGDTPDAHSDGIPILPPWAQGRVFSQALLDENAMNHIALGEGYAFCLRSADDAALNRSLIHVDVPVAAKANLRAGPPEPAHPDRLA